MSQGRESTTFHPTYSAVRKVWCWAVRQHNGQKRADTWSKGWMQNAAAGKRQLRKTQPNCSHTSTRVVVPNNHSASVVDRYAQEKSPPIYTFTFTEETRMGAPTVSHFLILLRFTPSFFLLLFLTKRCCTIFTKKWTLKTLCSQTQPLTVAYQRIKGTHFSFTSHGESVVVWIKLHRSTDETWLFWGNNGRKGSAFWGV